MNMIDLTAGWGLVVCVLAMLSAAAVEYARLQKFKNGEVLPGRHGSAKIVALSVFWQIPQYLLVGLSEVSLLYFCTHYSGFSVFQQIQVALKESYDDIGPDRSISRNKSAKSWKDGALSTSTACHWEMILGSFTPHKAYCLNSMILFSNWWLAIPNQGSRSNQAISIFIQTHVSGFACTGRLTDSDFVASLVHAEKLKSSLQKTTELQDQVVMSRQYQRNNDLLIVWSAVQP